jgi:RNA ligase
MQFHEILDVNKLNKYIRQGYITRRAHPHLPLVVLDYTEKTVNEQLWDDITRQCRGLVLDSEGVIVAHCMHKFFRHGDDDVDIDGPLQTTIKLDGVMGSVAFYQGNIIVTAGGSFESGPALSAYQHIIDNYYEAFKILCNTDGVTGIFIIQPDDIVLLGVISDYLYSNKQLWTPADLIYSWPGPVVERITAVTFNEAVSYSVTKKQDLVIYFEDTGERMSIEN